MSEYDLLDEQTRLGDDAEATGVYLHELGNVLNNILLDAKLMQRDVPAEVANRLKDSCDLITESANQLKQLAQYRQRCRTAPYKVNIHEQIIAAIDSEHSNHVRFEHTDDLPAIIATVSDVDRVLRLSLKNALSISSDDDAVVVTGQQEDDHVLVEMRIAKPHCAVEQIPFLLMPFHYEPERWDNLEAAVCQNLMRRMNGRLSVRGDESFGLTIQLQWPCA